VLCYSKTGVKTTRELKECVKTYVTITNLFNGSIIDIGDPEQPTSQFAEAFNSSGAYENWSDTKLLNYMDKNGWTLVTVVSRSMNNTPYNVFIFKKKG
jgi:hypothetical protein